MRGPATQVIDLEGRSLVPGFIDTHGHGHFVSPRGSGLVSGGNLTCETVQKCLEEIQAGVAKAQPGEWVRFGGVRNDVLIIQVDRWDLDKVSPDNPIWDRDEVFVRACSTRLPGKQGRGAARALGWSLQGSGNRGAQWTHPRPGERGIGP